ncbi:MAG: class I tRNA ligase family protein, partial [Bacteriovoracia bacterium]
DLGYVSTKEPFQKLVNQGMILGEDGEKMSKSRGNVINPDDVVHKYGADTLRLYEMFMGPLEKVKPWSMQGVKGVYNFISKAYKFFGNIDNIAENHEDEATLKMLHKTIKKVTEDIEAMKFNTAISQLMIFTNHCVKVKKVNKDVAVNFARILYPFAPHASEEIANIHDVKETLTYRAWPEYIEALTKDEMVTLAVQINGKTRGTFEVAPDISKDEFLSLVKNDERMQKYFEGKTIVKEIFIPKKIANFVLK